MIAFNNCNQPAPDKFAAVALTTQAYSNRLLITSLLSSLTVVLNSLVQLLGVDGVLGELGVAGTQSL
jgi:hypothetical protein